MAKSIWLVLASVAVTVGLQPAPALAQTCNGDGDGGCIYSIKFTCGAQSGTSNPPSEPPVKPGNYATSINIQNLQPISDITVRAVIANAPNQARGAISRPSDIRLQRSQAVEFGCSDIVGLFSPPVTASFIEGFVNIDSEVRDIPGTSRLPRLSVTAVYTAQAAAQASSVQATTAAVAQPGPVSIQVVPVQPIGIDF